jgi:hypothetical protein
MIDLTAHACDNHFCAKAGNPVEIYANSVNGTVLKDDHGAVFHVEHLKPRFCMIRLASSGRGGAGIDVPRGTNDCLAVGAV